MTYERGHTLAVVTKARRISLRLYGQIGSSVKPNAQDLNGKEVGDVAGQLPILPLVRLASYRGVQLKRYPFGCPSCRSVCHLLGHTGAISFVAGGF